MSRRRPRLLRFGVLKPTVLLLLWILGGEAGLSLAGPLQLSNKAIHDLAANMTAAYAKVKDYTTTFVRRGRRYGELSLRETILLKFRKPFSVYMKWIKEPKKDRELIYVQGWNDGQFIVSMGSFPYLTLNLDPRGTLVKRDSFGHTLLEVGMGYIVKTFAENLKKCAKRPQDGCKVLDLGIARVQGERVRCLKGIYASARPGVYYAPQALLCLNLATGLPVYVEIYDQSGKLNEEYSFLRTRINVGLSDLDFDPKNPKYGF